MRIVNRSGLSVIEVVVVIAILGILIGLTVAAVQSARETARKTQCQSNLRQNALAAQAFHNVERSLPSFYNGTASPYPLQEWDLFHMHSWRVPLLPHLEQQPLHGQIDFSQFATKPGNLPVGQTAVSVFICPSGPDAQSNMGWGLKHEEIANQHPFPPAEAYRYYVVRSDYDAMAGIQVLPDPFPAGASSDSFKWIRWGVWGWPRFETGSITGTRLLSYRAGKFKDVTDGLSNTIAIVERGGKPIHYLKRERAVSPGNSNAYYPGQVGWSASNTFMWSINGSNVGVNDDNSRGIYSLHRGGAYVALADGSVKFLSESMEMKSLIQLFSRSGGPDE